ncbi:MAG: hypothetical protein Q4C22_05715 [Bacillota bacterium]|nr:hypothetical protein [Bacillota bacterium]
MQRISSSSSSHVKYLAALSPAAPFFLWGAFFPVSASAWLALPAACALALPLLWLCSLLLERFPALKDAALWPLSFLSLFAALASLRASSVFMGLCVLPQLPPWLPSLCLGLFSFWIALRGPRPLLGFCALSCLPVLALLLLSILSAASKIDPHFTYRYAPFTPQGFLSCLGPALLLFFFHGLLLIVLFPETEASVKNPRAAFFQTVRGFIPITVLLTAACWSTALALGPGVFESLSFPLYYPPGLTRTAEYLERIELLLLAVYFFAAVSQLGLLFLSFAAPFRRLGARMNRRRKDAPDSLSG